MPDKYINIQRLIEAWETFENTNQSLSLKNFGIWLASNENLSKQPGNGQGTSEQKQQFLSLISRLSRFNEFYIKKLFEGMAIHSALEFNFLQFINKNISVKKKEVIDQTLVEYTTGIDIIKRLIKNGLVSESKDETDKRSKRLKITPAGKKVLLDAFITLRKMDSLFFDQLEETSWAECLHALQKMESFHTKVFTKCNNSNGYGFIECLRSEIDKTDS